MALPTTEEEALNGARVNLQRVLAGKRAVLILGFSKDARPQTSAWHAQLAEALAAAPSPAPAVFELPLMEGLPGLLRGMVLRSMRKAIAPSAQGSVLPVFSHKKEWQSLAGYAAPDDAYVLVVDEGQAVLASHHGPVTKERLTAVLAAVRPGAPGG